MANINKVIIAGRLTRDPELRYTQAGTANTYVGLAINNRRKDKNTGEWKDDATFVDCKAWGKTAENINQYFSKGRQIMIEGSLRSFSWEAKDGSGKRSKTEVHIESFHFLSDGNKGGKSGGFQRKQPQEFATGAPPSQAEPLSVYDMPDEDLPF